MKDPIYLYKNMFTAEGLKFLEENNIKDVYGFVDSSLSGRAKGLAQLLKRCLDNSDHGRNLSVDAGLASELKDVLASACYLFNSTSYRDGKYHEFDRQEIDWKLRRKK